MQTRLILRRNFTTGFKSHGAVVAWVRVTEVVKHEADRGKGDHGLGELGQVLVIPGQTPPTAEPAECPFDHPPAWQHDEALRAWDTVDDDQRDAEQEAGK